MIKGILATAVIAPLAVAGAAILPSVAANAATSPAVYVNGMGAAWSGAKIRPSEIAFGAHYDVASLHWTRWEASSAFGHGHYYGFGSYNAAITLAVVRTHDGRKYFAQIKIAESGHPTRYLHYYPHDGRLWQSGKVTA